MDNITEEQKQQIISEWVIKVVGGTTGHRCMERACQDCNWLRKIEKSLRKSPVPAPHPGGFFG